MNWTRELPEDIFKTYGKSKIETRFNTLYQEMDMFIRNSGFSEFLTINQDLLVIAVNNYFLSMNEICQFHRINHFDEQRKVSYTAYWLLYRKPIQVYNDLDYYASKLATVNGKVCIAIYFGLLK